MKTSYIFVGDSIVYGIGDFEKNGWTSMFKNNIIRLDSNSLYCSNYVHIAAYPGATSSDIVERMPSILGAFASPTTKNEVVLSVGVNDTQLLDGNTLRVNLETFKANIAAIIGCANKVSNCTLTILGLTRIGTDQPFEFKPGKSLSNATIGQYDVELRKLCEEHRIPYIYMGDALEPSDYADTLHPNTVGHQKIFGRVLERIKEREDVQR